MNTFNLKFKQDKDMATGPESTEYTGELMVYLERTYTLPMQLWHLGRKKVYLHSFEADSVIAIALKCHLFLQFTPNSFRMKVYSSLFRPLHEIYDYMFISGGGEQEKTSRWGIHFKDIYALNNYK